MSQWRLWPRKCKSQHSVLVTTAGPCCVPTSILAPARQLFNLEKAITSLKRVTLVTLIPLLGMFDNHCAGLQFGWCLYVCRGRIWTNPATCVRSTVSLPPDAEAYYRAQTFSFLSKAVGKKWVEDTTLRHSGRWFERLLFGRCSGCEFKMAEMRESECQSVIYCCIQWDYTLIQAASDMIQVELRWYYTLIQAANLCVWLTRTHQY